MTKISNKIKTIEEIAEIANALRKQGKKIVFTNGCFDLLHLGHVKCLQEARKLGDALVVALNSDASIRGLKGPSRPLVPENERAEILSALECIDYVVIFNELRMNRVFEAVKPQIYVKGGDYTIDTLDAGEREMIEKSGAKIHIIKKIGNYSTTNILNKISGSV